MLLLQLADKWAVDAVSHINSIQTFLAEHIDILTLLFLIGYIVDHILMLFFCVVQTVLKSQIFAIQILEQDVIFHLLLKLLIL